MNIPTSFLGYRHYNIGFGKAGKISNALSIEPDELDSIVHDLNQRQAKNVYLRVNADSHSHEPSRFYT